MSIWEAVQALGAMLAGFSGALVVLWPISSMSRHVVDHIYGDPRWTLTVEHIGSLVWKWELEGGGIEVVGTSFTRNGAVRGAKRWLAKDARRSRSRRVYDWDEGFRL